MLLLAVLAVLLSLAQGQANARRRSQRRTPYQKRRDGGTSSPSSTSKALPPLEATTKNLDGIDVIANFITDERLLEELADEALWRRSAEELFFPKWLKHNTQPQDAETIWDQLALKTFRDHPLVQKQLNSTKSGASSQYFAGYAYSCSILSAPNLSPWYISKDGMAYEHHKPLLQAVYLGYPHTTLTQNKSQAFLEVLPVDQTETRGPQRYASNNPERVQRAQLDYNRLVRFDTTKWHRFVEQNDKSFQGDLFVFFVDIWKFKPQHAPQPRFLEEEEEMEGMDELEQRWANRALPWDSEL